MANGPGAVFFQEVLDAIAKNPPDVGDLFVLRDLCRAVEADDTVAGSRLTRELARLQGPEDPLHSISYELFHALMARMLLRGWFEEFDILLNWEQTWFGEKNAKTAGKWEGILKVVKAEPHATGLATLSIPEILGHLSPEERWMGLLNGLAGALAHLAKAKLPPPSSPKTVGAPPIGPDYRETVLPRQLGEAIEDFFRLLQMLHQQLLELAVKRLELNGDDAGPLLKLAELQKPLSALLEAQEKLASEITERGLTRRIRVAEFRYGRANQHRFLDAFPRHAARSVIFHSLDRDDKDKPQVRGEKLVNIHKLRQRQLGFYFAAYGHPFDPKEPASAAQTRRRALIRSKHGGRLKLTGDDDLVAFLSSIFDEEFAEIIRPRPKRLPSPLQPSSPPPSRPEAMALAWRTAVETMNPYLGQLTSHSRLNLTEGPPNYLTHAFPRNLGGRLLHDCGVYAVRAAYTLLSLLDRIKQLHAFTGTVDARWVRLPLHVGLIIESSRFGLIVQHNENLFVVDNDTLNRLGTEWIWNRPRDEVDPPDVGEAKLKFHEDLAASFFSGDVDMPVGSTPVLEAGEPATTQTIWSSYQRKVAPAQLFTPLVGARNAPQYQFDNRYLKLSEREREWYNEHMLRFWNDDCKDAWENWKEVLRRSSNDELKRNKQAYTDELKAAMAALVHSYKTEILPEKERLSLGLRKDSKQLLLPRVRIVASKRIKGDFNAVRTVDAHIDEVSSPGFTFPRDFVPPFARDEEELLEMP